MIIKKLLAEYTGKENIILNDTMEFHIKLECIHPFRDVSGNIGKLIISKKCLINLQLFFESLAPPPASLPSVRNTTAQP